MSLALVVCLIIYITVANGLFFIGLSRDLRLFRWGCRMKAVVFAWVGFFILITNTEVNPGWLPYASIVVASIYGIAAGWSSAILKERTPGG